MGPDDDDDVTPVDSPLARRHSTRRLQVVSFLLEYEKRLRALDTLMARALVEEAARLRAALTAARDDATRDEAYRAIKAWNDRASAVLSGRRTVSKRRADD
jgi:hypothetical protein